MRRTALPVCLAVTAATLAGFAAVTVSAQQSADYTDPAAARQALAEARRQGDLARQRADALERRAGAAQAAADRSAAEAAAAAARIQQTEAGITAEQARMALIDRQRAELDARLAQRQQPLVRLTAALQRLSLRPLAFSLLRPGTVRDSMHLSAMLATLMPEVAQRTSALRAEIDRSRALKAQASETIAALRREQASLAERRAKLASIENAQRFAARDAAGIAGREAERALALGEQARDLSALVDDLRRAGTLREELAALPGPVLRPAGAQAAAAIAAPAPEPSGIASAPPAAAPEFLLPVQGRIVAGFGSVTPGNPVSRGIVIASRPEAQAIAPGPGRIAFAGPYRGFGQIVIVDHGGGWTSLVTGLARLNAQVGETVVGGSPLGTAGPGRPTVGFELRREGEPVNPVDFANP
ncbi:MAG: peptidoglycan DD-metalloendopeptidase family protein [Novosphingobium sp.]